MILNNIYIPSMTLSNKTNRKGKIMTIGKNNDVY
jgi:hypothetical protein